MQAVPTPEVPMPAMTVLARHFFATLLLAGATSLGAAPAPASETLMGCEESSYPTKHALAKPQYRAAPQQEALPPTSGHSFGVGDSWDFSGPDDAPGTGPQRPCDYLELMTRAMGR
jgi:hypothetical protein